MVHILAVSCPLLIKGLMATSPSCPVVDQVSARVTHDNLVSLRVDRLESFCLSPKTAERLRDELSLALASINSFNRESQFSAADPILVETAR